MNDTYMRMIRGERTSYTPVWFMRQAGRSQKRYREIKKKYSLFDITHRPELCAEVTALPVEEYGVDAAILYKDIVTPLCAVGVPIRLESGVGPVLDRPFTDIRAIESLRALHPEGDMPFVLETIRILTKERLQVPLIGFAGAPFTLATYLIECGPSKTYNATRMFIHREPRLFGFLMERLTEITSAYLIAQVRAGAHALQIFDSWAGTLGADTYRQFVMPHMKSIVSSIRTFCPDVPITLHTVGAMHLMPIWAEADFDVVGLDWRMPIADAKRFGIYRAVQGNLDPALLAADDSVWRREVDRILREGVEHGGHIFNLGHGVLPETDQAVLRRLTEYVHERSGEMRG